MALRQYADELLGRKFTRDPRVYVRAMLHKHQDDDFSSLFCSQLVAGAFKRLGLLPHDQPANNYLPEDFAARRQLPLLNGHLGREHVVMFTASSPYAPDSLQSLLQMDEVSKAVHSRLSAASLPHLSLSPHAKGSPSRSSRSSARSEARPSAARANQSRSQRGVPLVPFQRHTVAPCTVLHCANSHVAL